MRNQNKCKIISIMPHGPPYHFSPDEKPDIYWEKPDGSLVGFWPREWLDFLGEVILKETDRYDWEVWQPDYRADKIYKKTLETGVTHSLFPAEERIYRLGISAHKGICSDEMILRLRELQHNKIILFLYNTYGFRAPFNNEILKLFGPENNFPIFFRGGGQFKAPISEMMELHRPLTYLDLIAEHYKLKKLILYVDVISEQSRSALKEVAKVYNGRIEKLTMGCDFNFWVPVPSLEIKKLIRDQFNISRGKTVFFASGNYVPLKQLDKLIEVFRAIHDRNDFFLFIAGHGDEKNTSMLRQLAEPLVKQQKAILHPFVTGEGLREIYWASDLYVSVSTNEGGPVSVMKAMACGLPVLSTPVGETSDRMMRHDVGQLIPIRKYDKWTEAIINILEGELPASLDMQTARHAYHWPYIAQRFIRIFDDLLRNRH